MNLLLRKISNLLSSVDRETQRATVRVLRELGVKDREIIHRLGALLTDRAGDPLLRDLI